MRDLDELLDSEVSRSAARSATPRSFDDLQGRGRRRQRRTRAIVMLGAAAMVAVGVVGSQIGLPTPDRAPVDVPLPTPSSTPDPGPKLTATEVVDHPNAQLRGLRVSAEDPQVRAAVWQVCFDKRCNRRRTAVTVTGNGFEDRTDLDVPGEASPVVTVAGPDAFYVSWGSRTRMILHADGRTVPIRLADDAGPVGEGEVVARFDYGPARFVAVDPATGAAHRITTPPETTELELAPDGRLVGVSHDDPAGQARAVWSEDGGVTWQQRALPMTERSLPGLVEGGGEGAMTVLTGGDGATLLPFGSMHRSRDGGRTWEDIDVRSDPRAYVGLVAVLPDGRLLVDVLAWSDQRINRMGSRPVGLHVSDGDDWAELLAVGDRVSRSIRGTARSRPWRCSRWSLHPTPCGSSPRACPTARLRRCSCRTTPGRPGSPPRPAERARTGRRASHGGARTHRCRPPR